VFEEGGYTRWRIGGQLCDHTHIECDVLLVLGLATRWLLNLGFSDTCFNSNVAKDELEQIHVVLSERL
jgi:hypothetical protein